ncbi:MAG: amidohydrolase [Luminiphilus sp.]|nr:amidohydrolase [Luminiphilus sp.]
MLAVRQALIILVAIGLIACESSELEAEHSPDTIVIGTLYTMNPLQPRVEAVAIRNGIFVFVGGEDAALELASPATRLIELNEDTALPGLIDAHVHIAGIGSAMRSVDLTGAGSFDEIVARIKERASNLPENLAVLGRGWHQSKWRTTPEGAVDGFPTHHTLSAAVPSHAVVLEHANGHSALLNQRAMDLLDINAASVVPEGGVIVMHDGRPTGLLHETAIDLATPLKAYDLQTAEELVDLAQQHLLSQGITTAHDAGALKIDLDAQLAMAERGDLNLRLYSMVYASDERALSEWLDRGPLINAGDSRFTVRSIKVQADGALGSRTAWLHAPYADAPDTAGVLTYDLAALSELIGVSREDSWQMSVHAIGDRANSEVLSVFAPYTQADTDHRFRIEHAQHLRRGDGPLFAQQGVIASMQPIHLSSDRLWAIDRLGPQRIDEGAYIWRDLLNEGVVIAAGTDSPVEPVNPIANFYAAITRKTLTGQPGAGFEPAQKLTRLEALHSMTLAAAYAGFEEQNKGSIEVGKLADLTILSQDLLTIPEARILETEVTMTLVGGKVMYRRQADSTQ